jgi:hypothetical protein
MPGAAAVQLNGSAECTGNWAQPGQCCCRSRRLRHREKDGTIIDVEVTGNDLSFDARPGGLVLAQEVGDRPVDQVRRSRGVSVGLEG